ncbi:hypothetical protein ACFYZZ_12455, partial [Streptomyces sp. NPDC001816]
GLCPGPRYPLAARLGGLKGGRVRRADRGAVRDAGRAAVAACRCSLDLHVKVAKGWQRDPKQLRRLGF